MKKRLLYSLSGLIIILAAVVAVATGINAYDPPLDPEVVRIVGTRYTPTDQQRNAYFYLLGLYAGDTADPQKKGAEIWKKWAGDPPPDSDRDWWPHFRIFDPWKTQFPACERTDCEVAYINAHTESLEWLTKEREKIDHYIHLIGYGSAASMFESRPWIPMGDVLKIHVSLHRLLLLQFGAWAKAGEYDKLLKTMTDSNRYARSLFGHGTLLETLIALVCIRGNAEFLDIEMKRNPKLKISPELAESFVLPSATQIMDGALNYELRILAWVIGNIRGDLNLFLLEDADNMSNALKKALPVKWFFRPNETINNYHELTQESLKTTCPASDEPFPEIRCLPMFSWLMPSWPLAWLINPVGRALTRVMFINVAGRWKSLQKNFDTINGFQRKFAGEFEQK